MNETTVCYMSPEEIFSPAVVAQLASGNLLAAIVSGFVDAADCALLADRLIADRHVAPYSTSDGASAIKRVGMALFETVGDRRKRNAYFAEAIQSIETLRAISRPHSYPIDLLRLTLEERWPVGADLERFLGRASFVGLPRIFGESSEALPHVDRLAWDAPDFPGARDLVAQLAANVHLRAARQGGEIDLWQLMPDERQYAELRLAGTYGLDRTKLPEPDAVVRAAAGDLVLFNAFRVHAVRRCQGERVALSCFIGYRGPEKPLSYWS